MAKAKKPTSKAKKKLIEQYAHKGKRRANHPNVHLHDLEFRVIFPHQ